MAVLLYIDPLCLAHDAGPQHVESPQRLQAMLSSLRELPPNIKLCTIDRAATYEDLLLAHSPQYVQQVLSLAGTSASLDEETHLGPQSVDAARHAVGVCLSLVDDLIDGMLDAMREGTARRAFALVRPPGHHANRDAGSGFCIFNNIALAACHARRRGVSRVLIVDWDVHHGNGTQAIFYDRSDVYFFDVHQDGLWPDTGAATELGAGAGQGYTRNLPLMPMSTDDDYLRALTQALIPVAEAYEPELILVSCGFDAHDADLEGGMSLQADAYARMTTLVCQLADRFCAGRIGLILEGGYALSALPDCVRATVSALSKDVV